MHVNHARAVLGVPWNASVSEVKAAYKQKAFESHPDRFPSAFKDRAETRFKLVTEAYQFLITGNRLGSYDMGRSATVAVARKGNKGHHIAASLPFVFLIAGTLVLGGSCAARAYRRQQHDSLSHNPFLP
ncbi:hypothetical protein O6H91_01G056600 [Diphasiastrum complanatum]|uniref:Uncharacterized protein n=2 Tax=Diphasiastrum complanatum TaxID=34168 RepID=A0ACC2ERA4_DIPCM|nr:hypothetical protein O6H91_01G056600 [Diphasiastrum complanatum]KAJ7569000.1 hypothetical protein O6H91_01G056600 [Diphasiastrum complanatum]